MSDDRDIRQDDDIEQDDSAASSPQDAKDPVQHPSEEGADEVVEDQPGAEADEAAANVTPPSESEGSSAGRSDGSDELAEVKDALLRTRADFENFKRRAEEERARTIQMARSDVVLDLLPVIDNFDRAFEDVPQEIQDNNWYQGVAAIKQQFEKLLEELGIERIETVGQEFDPELHEAIAHEASDQAENVVVKEFEAGYRLGDAVIRHARVAVSSGQSPSGSDNNSEESKEN